jgi:hypothetical protein
MANTRNLLPLAGLLTLLAPAGQAQCFVSGRLRAAFSRPAIGAPAVQPGPAIGSQAAKHEPAQAIPAREAAQAADATIVGLWKVTFTSGGQVTDLGFDLWHADGTEVLNDDPPPSTGNVCVGVWASAGHLSYKLKHVSWIYDNSGNLTGTATIRENIMLAASGNSYKGSATVDIYDLEGNNVYHDKGELSAERITVD